ncbi:hypothetical protein INR49_009670 [Caranx melampygus]|nr:hypothetical protein INR49_009670 [Caranx melampygus]
MGRKKTHCDAPTRTYQICDVHRFSLSHQRCLVNEGGQCDVTLGQTATVVCAEGDLDLREQRRVGQRLRLRTFNPSSSSSSSLLHRSKSAVAARESNWNESIRGMSCGSCLAAPAKA